jgi:hypothetical protein
MSCCQTQVRPILKFAHGIHSGLIERLEELLEEGLLPRAQFVAEYLLNQEQRLEEAVNQGLKFGASGTLDAFVDAKLTLDVESVLEISRIPESPTVDDLTGAVFTVRDTLIDIFKESARCASDRRVKDLFLGLWRLEEGERNHIASAVMQLNEM